MDSMLLNVETHLPSQQVIGLKLPEAPRRAGEVIPFHTYQTAAEGQRPASRPSAEGVDTVMHFDHFEIHQGQRAVLANGRQLRLGSRAFDLLVALCRRPGEVVSNRELLAAAWPKRVVDEGSIRVHIASLRKALGDGVGDRRYITNVPMRGYCFVAPVKQTSSICPPTPSATSPGTSQAITMLPVGRSSVPPEAAAETEFVAPRAPFNLTLVGREREAAALLQALQQSRCVTLVGTGGIGKTSMALPVARQFAQEQGCEVILVELAALSRQELVPMAIAAALGIVAPDHQALPAIAAFLRSKRPPMLLLDNCEHVIDGVAAAAEHILTHAPNVHLLATSREAMRIHGEWVQCLEPLHLPPPSMQARARDAMQYPAVQLFVERASASSSRFTMGDEEALLVCNICRRLDGIPLAIELAAGAIDAVGLKGLVERLGHRLGSRLVIVGRGRRTAQPRHQTLRATLDWSHDLLPAREQELLACLSVFRGAFNVSAAQAVFNHSPEVLDICLAALVSKSLVVSEKHGNAVAYRLLETTREYAAERLAMIGQSAEIALRHATHLLQIMRSDEPTHGDCLLSNRDADSMRWVDDLREAAQWSFSQQHTQALGVSLMAWSSPLWFSMSMLAEYKSLAEQAIAIIDSGKPGDFDPEEEMRLCETLGHALWHTRGGGEAMVIAFNRALVIAERLRSTIYRLRCRWGLWLACIAEGDYHGSYRMARQFGDILVPSHDSIAQRTYERMMALGAHLQGDQVNAERFAHLSLDRAFRGEPATQRGGFQLNHRVAALTVNVRVAWLRGEADRALAMADEAVQEALRIDHSLSLCYAIAIGAAPVAFWCGDHKRAKSWVALLRQRAVDRSLPFWLTFGEGYQHVIDLEDGVARPGDLEARIKLGLTVREHLTTIDPRFLDDEMRRRAASGDSGWCTCELMRIEGERLMATDAIDEAAQLFGRAIEIAREQRAVAWELRCVTSLARLQIKVGRRAEVRNLLEPMVHRHNSLSGHRDIRIARELLAAAQQ